MPTNRPIRALARGLKVLTVLNSGDGSTVSEIALATRLPRTTVYRVLETLAEEGYVTRDESDERYRLTILVRGLSDGFDDEAWVTQIAKPYIFELGREIVWPVSIATISGTSMLVRQTTDHASPLAVERYAPGYRLPVLESAAGLAFLAFCPASQRETLLDVLARSEQQEQAPVGDRQTLERQLDEVRTQGFAVYHRPRRVSDRTSLAVPILAEDRVLALLVVRYARTAIPLPQAVQRFVPRMREMAVQIAAGVAGGDAASGSRLR
ncbi:MAG TPA: helix-turn-helix domain-containing protein [Steroidobacteraceae bacterium]|nr:helix-turn-helix domain-containing protein [Steroidobacteraceae bacterium]